MNEKIKDKVFGPLKDKYENFSVSIRTITSEIDPKNPVLLAHEFCIKDPSDISGKYQPVAGVEYSPDGETPVNVYTFDEKGKRINHPLNAAESGITEEFISRQLQMAREIKARQDVALKEAGQNKQEQPAPQKSVRQTTLKTPVKKTSRTA